MADLSPRPLINPPRRGSDLGPLPATPPAPAPAATASADVVEISPPANGLENRIRDMLTSEQAERDRPSGVVNLAGAPADRAAAPSASGGQGQAAPADGLLSARNDLDARSRESTKMVRLMDRHRQQLERAEQDLEQMGEALTALLPSINEAASALKVAMRNTRRSDDVQSLGEQFTRSGTALDELEALAGNLGAQLLWTRSAWEQYCKTVVVCQRLRGGQSAS